MAGQYFAVGGLPLNFALFSSISVLQPLDVSSSPAVTRKMSTVGVRCPCWRSPGVEHWPREKMFFFVLLCLWLVDLMSGLFLLDLFREFLAFISYIFLMLVYFFSSRWRLPWDYFCFPTRFPKVLCPWRFFWKPLAYSSNLKELPCSGFECLLFWKTGARVGHRSLMRYYKQRFGLPRAVTVARNQKAVGRVLQQYRALGWTGSTGTLMIRGLRGLGWHDIIALYRVFSEGSLTS